MTKDPRETNLTIQDVDCGSLKYLRSDKQDSSWAAKEGTLVHTSLEPPLNTKRAIDMDVDGYFCPGSWGRDLPTLKKISIKKVKSAREKGDLEAEGPEKPDKGWVVQSYFNLPNEPSGNIVLTGSDFILTERTCAIAITADMSYRTTLAANFRREYKNSEFLWKQTPGAGGAAALPPAA